MSGFDLWSINHWLWKKLRKDLVKQNQKEAHRGTEQTEIKSSVVVHSSQVQSSAPLRLCAPQKEAKRLLSKKKAGLANATKSKPSKVITNDGTPSKRKRKGRIKGF